MGQYLKLSGVSVEFKNKNKTKYEKLQFGKQKFMTTYKVAMDPRQEKQDEELCLSNTSNAMSKYLLKVAVLKPKLILKWTSIRNLGHI